MRRREIWRQTYKRPETNSSVETEADWKAGQVVDPVNWMHAAMAAGDVDRTERIAVRRLGLALGRITLDVRRPIGL